MYYIIYSNELRHHGIKGQKWGVRRFQNEDGSYTAEGEKRYGRSGKRRGENGGESSGGKSGKRQMSKGTKTALIVGGVFATAALATIGGYAAYKMNEDKIRGTKLESAAKKGWYYAKKFKNYESPVNTYREEARSMKDDVLKDAVTRITRENTYVKQKLQSRNDPKFSRWDYIAKAVGTVGTAASTVAALRDNIKKSRATGNGDQDLSGMSDQELREAVNRANLEKQYRNMYQDQGTGQSDQKGRIRRAIDVTSKGIETAKEAEETYRKLRRKKKT